jgi:putative transposase
LAKRNVTFKKGRYYHIYNRGANRNKIFFEKENYLYLLRKLKSYSIDYQFSVIAYCLMSNHYHFLLRQDGDEPINIPVAYLFNTYTKAINKKSKRTGTLFEGSFKCIEVEDEKYMLELCRYIHRNPIDDEVVEKIEDWEFSNYLEWIGKRNGSLIDLNLRDKHYQGGKGYEEYVMDYLSDKQARNELRKYLLKKE